MSDVKISELPQATEYNTGMEFAVNDAGTTKKIAGNQFNAARGSSITLASSDSNTASKYGVDRVIDVSEDAGDIINGYINSFGASGGKIILLEGTYYVSTKILCVSYLTLKGTGRVRLIRNAAITSIIEIPAVISYVIIDELYLEGMKSTYTGNYDGVYTSTITYCIIKNCTINNNGRDGIRSECRYHNTIKDNIISNNTGYGLYVKGDGLGNTRDNSFSNNIIFGNDIDGIYVENSNYNRIIMNSCLSNGASGINLKTSLYNTLQVNTLRTNTTNGILLDDCNNCSITGNVSTGNDIGINLTDDTDDNTITGNSVNGNTTDGIYISANAGGNIVQNNKTVTGNGASDITDDGGTASTNDVQSNY